MSKNAAVPVRDHYYAFFARSLILHTTIFVPWPRVVAVVVFDIGDLHVKGREWKVKGRGGVGAYL